MASRSADPQSRAKKARAAEPTAKARPGVSPLDNQLPPASRSRLPTPMRGQLHSSAMTQAQMPLQAPSFNPMRSQSTPTSDWEQPVVTAPNALRELPVQSLQATLCILSANVYAGVEVLVDRKLRIGRDPDNDIRLPGDVSMSRHHAVFTPTADCLFIEDLGSTNGTLINGLPVQRAPLNHNDRVRIGDTLFQVRYEPLRALSQKTPPPATLANARGGLGDALRSWRRAQGLTQTELATRLGVSQRTVSLWEQGAPISAENLRNLREKGGCDVV